MQEDPPDRGCLARPVVGALDGKEAVSSFEEREPRITPVRIRLRAGRVDAEELADANASFPAEADRLDEAEWPEAEEDLERGALTLDLRSGRVVDPIVPSVPVDELSRRGQAKRLECGPDIRCGTTGPKTALDRRPKLAQLVGQ